MNDAGAGMFAVSHRRGTLFVSFQRCCLSPYGVLPLDLTMALGMALPFQADSDGLRV